MVGLSLPIPVEDEAVNYLRFQRRDQWEPSGTVQHGSFRIYTTTKMPPRRFVLTWKNLSEHAYDVLVQWYWDNWHRSFLYCPLDFPDDPIQVRMIGSLDTSRESGQSFQIQIELEELTAYSR